MFSIDVFSLREPVSTLENAIYRIRFISSGGEEDSAPCEEKAGISVPIDSTRGIEGPLEGLGWSSALNLTEAFSIGLKSAP